MNGRLAPVDDAPAEGENTTVLARATGFAVEQILSGRLDTPQDYEQDHDEWVVVLDGGAVLEIAGIAHELATGDWWFLPAGTPHRLVQTVPGTNWLAVRSD